jgi:hypothetical protein
VYAPWENRLVLNTKLGLPGHHITPEADQMRLENIRAAKSTLSLTDSMQALRKDWKDLEVFCIDDEDAREIDDGISLEEIPVRIDMLDPRPYCQPIRIYIQGKHFGQICCTPHRDDLFTRKDISNAATVHNAITFQSCARSSFAYF